MKSFPAYSMSDLQVDFKAFMLLLVLLNIKVDDSLFDHVLQTQTQSGLLMHSLTTLLDNMRIMAGAHCICRRGQDDLLRFKLSIRVERKRDPNDFECGMVV